MSVAVQHYREETINLANISLSTQSLSMFAHLILVCAVLGVAINITAIFLIRKKQKRDRSSFHDLLIILNTSDVGVVICCALLFALPTIWQLYKDSIFPHVGQFLLPAMHIAVMTSVYSTILIRYNTNTFKITLYFI